MSDPRSDPSARHDLPVLPCGTWPSPLSASRVAAGARPLAAPRAAPGGRVRWLEGVPEEGGRVVVVERGADGTRRVLTPAGFNVRTRVHEYGGGACAMEDDTLWFSNFGDHLVYEQRGDEAPRAITTVGTQRHADLEPDTARRRVIAVREDHGTGARWPVTSLVALHLDRPGESTTLAAGADFVAAPRVSPEGRRLAWLQWDLPRMPWEGTELWVAALGDDGGLVHARRVAGGPGQSLVQPQWGPDGHLYVASDRSGFWNLYRVDAAGLVPLFDAPIEFARPQWVFGQCTFGFLSRDRLLAAGVEQGRGALWSIDTTGREAPRRLDLPFEDFQDLRVEHGQVVALAGGPMQADAVLSLGAGGDAPEVLARSVDAPPEAGDVSVARRVSYPGSGGVPAHALYYAPRNAACRGPEGEAPPLVVMIHGGPTSMAASTLRLPVQFWTTRGFAVLDVNYGGSTGYGRAYRERLTGQWGVVDVEDCVAGAHWLAQQGLADPARLAIRGGSAGGYATLCALAFHDVFRAGTSLFGVGDLRALDQDTHKFESGYSEDLLGPADVRERLYAERSPLFHAEGIRVPVIFFQGLDDKVVLPSQSESMVAVLRSRGVPAAYLAFEGEGHGFRRRETIERALQVELAFYAGVFGFVPAGEGVEVPWVR